MPSKVQQVRRSTRQGKQRTVYTDTGTVSAPTKSSVGGKEPSADEPPSKKTKHVVLDSSVPESTTSEKKKVVWENYSKKDLYYKWLKARNDATDLRKERNDLDKVRIDLKKELRELQKELKEADLVCGDKDELVNENCILKSELEDEKEKLSESKLNTKKLMEERKNLMATMKEKYDTMTSKTAYENVTTLGQLKIKFTECDLKLKAKTTEVKELQEKNRGLKKKLTKMQNLLMAKNKLDLQVASMEEKSQVR